MRTTNLLLIALVIGISGCAKTPVYESTVEYPHSPLTLDSIRLPAPLSLPPIGEPIVEQGLMCWGPNQVSAFHAWQQEVDRYLRDLRRAWQSTLETVADHNRQHEEPEAPEEAIPPAPWYRRLFE